MMKTLSKFGWWLALVLYGLCLSPVARGFSESVERPLPVIRYSSPDARYSLEVDPSHRSGTGAAVYSMRYEGQLLWRQELNHTWWRAAVADNGASGGVGYTNGYQIWDPLGGNGEFVASWLNAGGQLDVLERIERKVPAWKPWGTSRPSPLARNVWIDTHSGELAMQIDGAPDATVDEWWLYALDGTRKKRIREIEPVATRNGQPVQALHIQAIGGSPITLVQWIVGEDPGRIVIAAYDDAFARAIWHWTHPVEADHSMVREAFLGRRARTHSAAPDGMFRSREVGAAAAVGVRVSARGNADAAWHFDVAFEPTISPAVMPAPVIPSLELSPRRITLGKPLSPQSPRSASAIALQPKRFGAIWIASDGAVLRAVDSSAPMLHFYRATGIEFAACAAPRVAIGKHFGAEIGVDRLGAVTVRLRGTEGEAHLRCDRNGKLLDVQSKYAIPWQMTLPHPKAERRWELDAEGMRLLDGRGKVLRDIQRLTSGEWLEYPITRSIANTGALALISGRYEENVPTKLSVVLFDPEGEEINSWPVAAEIAFAAERIAFNGALLATLSAPQDPGPNVRLQNTEGTNLLTLYTPFPTLPYQVWWVKAPLGWELWLSNLDGEVGSYAVPPWVLPVQ